MLLRLLRIYNVLVLLCLILYQNPLVKEPRNQCSATRWLGLYKFHGKWAELTRSGAIEEVLIFGLLLVQVLYFMNQSFLKEIACPGFF